MKRIKEMIKVMVFGYKATSCSYIRYLRKNGALIGDGVEIFRPMSTTIDVTAPYLLTIGNNVNITGPATILTHDYSWSVLKGRYGYICGNQKPTIIGNNVFVGWGATILAGVTVGDNVIIGAGAVVCKDCLSDSVYAGNPAKRVMGIEEYFAKRKAAQLAEAKVLVRKYYERHGELPLEQALSEYFFLFCDRQNLHPSFRRKLKLQSNEAMSLDLLKTQKPMFEGYEKFLQFVAGDILCTDKE